MIIKIIEKDPMALIQKVRARWVEHFKNYVGDIVSFATEFMEQSGFFIYCYMADHWLPISIAPQPEQDLNPSNIYFQTEIELDEKTDMQFTKEDPMTGYLTNVWFGPYVRGDELVQLIEARYKHYMELSVKKLKNPEYKYPF